MRLLFFICALLSTPTFAQQFNRQDTLRGSNTEFRNFWDVQRYVVTVEPDFDQKSLKGSNRIEFQVTEQRTNPVFQIDLQQPMHYAIDHSSFPYKTHRREGDFIFIEALGRFSKGSRHSVTLSYNGVPTEAKNAPWDGGWVFKRDSLQRPFASVAQEGIGTSVWLPLKDTWDDEPDRGLDMTIITPESLVGVGNGRLVKLESSQGKKYYTWRVESPINGYSIVPSIGSYVNFKDTFKGEGGTLDLDYWVLDYNLLKAQRQFTQVKPMLQAFEYWFGAYPFYRDSYKVVETPYLGMEHQSNVAYGNGYRNGYLGRDLSGTGVGLKWDFILIHETGHEWFANNITAKEKADMWIHEAFTSYSETLFTEKYLDTESANRYVQGTRQNIKNDRPIIGHYGVAKSGSGDMYYKGANMLHTIRQIINDDGKFRQIMRGLNSEFRLQTPSSTQIENYISKHSGVDLSTVFDQYLRTTKIPVLEYYQKDGDLYYRYQNTVPHLNLPIRLTNGLVLEPTSAFKKVKCSADPQTLFNSNYYLQYQRVNP